MCFLYVPVNQSFTLPSGSHPSDSKFADTTVSALTKPWKWPYIIRWEDFRNRNQPTISADEGFLDGEAQGTDLYVQKWEKVSFNSQARAVDDLPTTKPAGKRLLEGGLNLALPVAPFSSH